MKKFRVAIVGATGMVGTTFLKVLAEKDFPISELHLFAHPDEAGKVIEYRGTSYTVEGLDAHSFDRGIDIALFSAGGSVSEKFAPIAASKGTVVIDNSSAWRMDPTVPLVVPEVNPQDINWHRGIIANPNCSTIQAVVALKPLYDKYGIKRIVYSTYQAVSGSGINGIKEIESGMKGKDLMKVYPYPIVDNCLPHIDVFMPNDYTKEEMKMIDETKKILGDDTLKITATAVRVPVKFSHSESINVEFKDTYDISDLKKTLEGSKGIIVQDDVSRPLYPVARNAVGTNDVYIGRIRRDFSLESGLNMWVVADNVRKGAAANAVQIAELLIDKL